jgi:hypothetical protein
MMGMSLRKIGRDRQSKQHKKSVYVRRMRFRRELGWFGSWFRG